MKEQKSLSFIIHKLSIWQTFCGFCHTLQYASISLHE